MIMENGKVRIGTLDLAGNDIDRIRDFAAAARTAIALGHRVTISDSGIGTYGVIITAHAEPEVAPTWTCEGSPKWPCGTVNSGLDFQCARCEAPREEALAAVSA